MKHFRRWLGALCVLLIFFSLSSFSTSPVRAIDTYVFTVNSTLDIDDFTNNGVCSANTATGGPCTLRAAFAEANYYGNNPTKIIIPAGTYTLTIPPNQDTYNNNRSGDLNIWGYNITIKALGDGPVIIKSAIDDRILTIENVGNIQISDISFTNGNAVVRSINDSGGGAILDKSSSLYLTRVNFINNKVTCDPEPCTNDVASRNRGGAIESKYELKITDATFDGNEARYGSAIYSDGYSPHGYVYGLNAHIIKSTISNNRGENGTILNRSGMNIMNSTFSGNRSTGIINYQNLIIRSSTFANLGDVSAVDTRASSDPANPSSVFIQDSILLSEPGKRSCSIDNSSWTSGGYNIASDNSCQLTATGDLNSTDPKLYPLANNGGPTQTHAIMSDSPARDHRPGPCKWIYHPDYPVVVLGYDQRYSRRYGYCDTGSFEIFQPLLFLPFIRK